MKEEVKKRVHKGKENTHIHSLSSSHINICKKLPEGSLNQKEENDKRFLGFTYQWTRS